MQKRFHHFILPALLLAFTLLAGWPLLAQENTPEPTSPAPAERPAPAQTVILDGLTLEVYFSSLAQGRAGLLRVLGPDIAGARALFFTRQIDFFEIEDDAWYAFITAQMDLHPRDYDLSVLVWRQDESSTTLNTRFPVVLGGFVRQDFSLPADRAHLIQPEIERSELARVDAIITQYTPQRLWTEAGFSLPLNAPITSPFGAFRTINETLPTRHTGWDIRAAVGTPIGAMGDGVVAFAGTLDIRGNYVLIDHGFGVYSGYAHFSQIHVTRGQSIVAGQIIGVSGNTGRSSGPHLHWEVAVNGDWVDSLDFIAMWLP